MTLTEPRAVRPARRRQARRRTVARPITPRDPVELRLARSALAVVALLAVPVVALAALLAGPGGALGAAIGASVVAGMFLLTGALLSWAAPLGPTALMGAALGGYLLRLMIYAVLIVVLRPVEAIHGPSLAISAAVLLVAALVWEVRVVSRTAEFFWVDAAAGARESHNSVLYQRPPGGGRAADSSQDHTDSQDHTERTGA